MGPGAVLCTNCGYNTKTGKQIDAEASDSGPDTSGGGRSWPTVIGVVSIIFGGGGTLMYLLSLLANLLAPAAGGGASAGYSTGRIAGKLLPMVLCIWLLVSGIGILRRRQSAMVSIRRWAIAKIVIYALFFTCIFAGLFISAGSIDRLNEELGGVLGGLGVLMIALFLLLVLAWFLSWPVFILIWFGREKIQQDVGHWH